MISRTQYVLRDEQLAHRSLDGEAFILNPTDSRLYCLNETAARIWELADGMNTAENIAAVIYDEYLIEPDEVLEQVDAFLQSLSDRKLIRFRERPFEVSHGN